MFGDKPIIGLDENRKLDDKNRLIIPSFCNAEPEDELLIYTEEEFFSIYNVSDFLNQLNKKELESIKDFLLSKKLKDQVSKNTSAKLSVDQQKRITIPKHIIKKYNLESNVIAQGAFDHLNIYKVKQK